MQSRNNYMQLSQSSNGSFNIGQNLAAQVNSMRGQMLINVKPVDPLLQHLNTPKDKVEGKKPSDNMFGIIKKEMQSLYFYQ